MKNKKVHTKPHSPRADNPFVRIVEDKKKIREAISKGISLASLKGIKFVKPI